MEGAIFVTGAAVQWLRDGLEHHRRREPRPARSRHRCPTAAACYVVPAFTGLGSPWWDPYARGTIVGITRGTTRAHIARAVVEAMAFQTADVVDAITNASRTAPPELRVDGGASAMDLLCQFQADLLGVPVRRAAVQETTALGAAFLAGLAEGVWDSPADRERDMAVPTRRSTPQMDAADREPSTWPTGAARSNARAAGRRADSAGSRDAARVPFGAAGFGVGRDVRDFDRDVFGLRVAYVSTYS